MLFWTVVFFTMNFIFLFRVPFRETNIKIAEIYIQKAEGKITEKEYNNQIFKQSWHMFFLLLLFLGEMVYLISALKVDPLKYPTIILLVYFIINFAVMKLNKSVDLSTEEAKIKYRMKAYKSKTFKSILTNLIYCGYFGYMFYYLVF